MSFLRFALISVTFVFFYSCKARNTNSSAAATNLENSTTVLSCPGAEPLDALLKNVTNKMESLAKNNQEKERPNEAEFTSAISSSNSSAAFSSKTPLGRMMELDKIAQGLRLKIEVTCLSREITPNQSPPSFALTSTFVSELTELRLIVMKKLSDFISQNNPDDDQSFVHPMYKNIFGWLNPTNYSYHWSNSKNDFLVRIEAYFSREKFVLPASEYKGVYKCTALEDEVETKYYCGIYVQDARVTARNFYLSRNGTTGLRSPEVSLDTLQIPGYLVVEKENRP